VALVHGSMLFILKVVNTAQRWIEMAPVVGRNEGMKGWTNRTWKPA